MLVEPSNAKLLCRTGFRPAVSTAWSCQLLKLDLRGRDLRKEKSNARQDSAHTGRHCPGYWQLLALQLQECLKQCGQYSDCFKIFMDQRASSPTMQLEYRCRASFSVDRTGKFVNSLTELGLQSSVYCLDDNTQCINTSSAMYW